MQVESKPESWLGLENADWRQGFGSEPSIAAISSLFCTQN
jgi:hypothetical protein